MATSGQFYWPPVGNSVAAYGQFGMAANMALIMITLGPVEHVLPHERMSAASP